MNEVIYPEVRRNLIEILHDLYDLDYQCRVWVGGEKLGENFHDEFSNAVHFLYDDSLLASDPASTIGWILRDKNEVEKIEMLVNAIEIVFQKYGQGFRMPNTSSFQNGVRFWRRQSRLR